MPVADGLWRLHLRDGMRLSAASAHWHAIHQGPHSRIFRVDGADEPYIAKLIIPRSRPRDNLRKYGLSQAWRETKSNAELAHLGLHTMPVHGWGVSAWPTAPYESVLFMQPLPRTTSGLDLIRNEQDSRRRRAFLARLARDVACMLNNGFIHKDAHFDNVCLRADRELIWIDNDLRQPRTRAALRKGLGKMLSLLKTTARSDLRPDEWHFLTHTLTDWLNQSPQGRGLIDEIS